MTYYAIEIEPTPGFGFQGGPEFFTDIQNVASGREKRNGAWSICRHKYTAPFNNIPEDAYRKIKEVFLITRGRLHSFRHKDYGDFRAVDESFGTGDGATKTFQLSKTSTLGAGSYVRNVTKPNDDVSIKVAGVSTPASVDQTTGKVTFAIAPATGADLTWSGTFYVQVRFDNDYLPFSLVDKSGSSYVTNGSIDLIEVLDE